MSQRRVVSNKELLRTARGFMRAAEKHPKFVELTGTTSAPVVNSLYNAQSAIDQRRLSWAKPKD